MAVYGPNYAGGRYQSKGTGRGEVIYRLMEIESRTEHFKPRSGFSDLKEIDLLAYIDNKKVVSWSTIARKEKGLKRFPEADKTLQIFDI